MAICQLITGIACSGKASRVSFTENKYISKAISRGLKIDDEFVKKGGLRKNYLLL
ncbi:hypothetical protein PEDI_09000 [Persicobacter diffluens]|uniref:Uncharacterized protein n=1 Tax=Persicobacter diffluens TaxID=981 RepID=A0AAN4VWT3_9BACT|nr:hypothetical protein PEDI_09000 [Persicobacter diffluens]